MEARDPARVAGGPDPRAFTGSSAGALALLCSVQLLLLVDFSIVNVALPRIETALDFGRLGVQWVVSAYALAFGGLLLLGGRLSDLLGRRRMLVLGLVLFGIASLGGAVAMGPGVLVAMRALQGAGAALIAPAVLSIITTGFAEGAARNRAIGWFSAASASGFAVGVLLGGILTEIFDWRSVFYVNLPAVIIAIAGAYRLLGGHAPTRERRRYDVPGALLATAGSTGVIYGLSLIPAKGWGGLLWAAIGLGLLAGFVVVESRSASPLVPLGIFRQRAVSVANLASLIVPGLVGAAVLLLSLFLQGVQERSVLEAGLAFLPVGLAVMILGPISAAVANRFGPKIVCIGGAALVTAGMLLLSRITPTASYFEYLLPGLVVTGFGFTAFFATSAMCATAGIPEHQQGLAGGLLNTSVQFGTALWIAVMLTIGQSYANKHQAAGAAAQTDGYAWAFTIGGIVGLATAVLLALALPATRVPHPEPQTST
jgi:EmrB/QacA subfamily drug resistance transporter